MTATQAKELGFTHRGKIYGFPCFLTDDENMHIEGTNWFNDLMITVFVWIDTTFEINEAFMILKGDKL